jgi:hypothetical protein
MSECMSVLPQVVLDVDLHLESKLARSQCVSYAEDCINGMGRQGLRF